MSVIIVPRALYAGEHALRYSGNRAYVHLPIKTVEGLTGRKVKVIARVNARGCKDGNDHDQLISFMATLVKTGRTYRVTLPSYYAPLAMRIRDCGSLEIWLIPA